MACPFDDFLESEIGAHTRGIFIAVKIGNEETHDIFAAGYQAARLFNHLDTDL